MFRKTIKWIDAVFHIDDVKFSVNQNDQPHTWLLFSVELLLSESEILSSDSEPLFDEKLGLGLGGFCLAVARWDDLLTGTLPESSDDMLGVFTFATLFLAFFFVGRDYNTQMHVYRHT